MSKALNILSQRNPTLASAYKELRYSDFIESTLEPIELSRSTSCLKYYHIPQPPPFLNELLHRITEATLLGGETLTFANIDKTVDTSTVLAQKVVLSQIVEDAEHPLRKFADVLYYQAKENSIDIGETVAAFNLLIDAGFQL